MIAWRTFTTNLGSLVSKLKTNLTPKNLLIHIGIIREESESHFIYRNGESWATFYFPDFIPMFGPSFINSTLEKEAKEMCGEDQFCLFDVAATRRVEIGAATKQGQEMLDTIMEMSKPSKYIHPLRVGFDAFSIFLLLYFFLLNSHMQSSL